MNKKTVEKEKEKVSSAKSGQLTNYRNINADETFCKLAGIIGIFQRIINNEDGFSGFEALGLSLLSSEVMEDLKFLVYGEDGNTIFVKE